MAGKKALVTMTTCLVLALVSFLGVFSTIPPFSFIGAEEANSILASCGTGFIVSAIVAGTEWFLEYKRIKGALILSMIRYMDSIDVFRQLNCYGAGCKDVAKFLKDYESRGLPGFSPRYEGCKEFMNEYRGWKIEPVDKVGWDSLPLECAAYQVYLQLCDCVRDVLAGYKHASDCFAEMESRYKEYNQVWPGELSPKLHLCDVYEYAKNAFDSFASVHNLLNVVYSESFAYSGLNKLDAVEQQWGKCAEFSFKGKPYTSSNCWARELYEKLYPALVYAKRNIDTTTPLEEPWLNSISPVREG